MAKRYYLSEIIGNGTFGNSYRAKVQGPGRSVVAVMPNGPDGRPLHTHCLALVAAVDHSPLQAMPGVDPLPVFPLDARVSVMHLATRLAMIAAIEARGIPTDEINGADGYRDVIRAIGRHYTAEFDENAFDVSE